MKCGFLFSTLMLLTSIQVVLGQKVTVSREIGVRNNYAYDILPNIEDHIIFYHDRGAEHIFEIYDKNLRFIGDMQPEFEQRNILPTGVIPMDSSFQFYYTYKEADQVYFKIIAYDKNVSLIDSVTYNIKNKKDVNSNPRFVFSQDKSKSCVFTPHNQMLNIQLIDNLSLSLIYEFDLVVPGINLKNDFEKIVVTNDGELYILARKDSAWSRAEDNIIHLIRITGKDQISIHRFTPESDEITNIKLDFDNINRRVVMAGFTTSGNESNSNGYFGFSMSPELMPEDGEILINRYSSEFMSEVSGRRSKKAQELEDYKIQDVVVRHDGGVIIIAETVREFARRSQMNSPGQFGSSFPMRGYIDYYHEDLVLLATFPDGQEHWQKVLFKKQFSQDDNAVFSSYFIFKTPSRLHIIYNDEIKNNNTVSEYVLDPLGNYERKSVLSTEYQNLKLRFRDAIQTGSTSMIVPSEKSSKINLIKIDYTQ